MARVSLIIALSVLAFVTAARAYPSSQENSTEDYANWSWLWAAEIRASKTVMGQLCPNGSGSSETFLNLKESFEPIVACVSNLIPVDIFIDELEAALPATIEMRSNFFPRYCPQLRTAGLCVQGVVKAVKPCLKEEDFTIVSALANVLPEAIELICQKDGEAMFKNHDLYYQDCLDNIYKEPSKCDGGINIDKYNLFPFNLTQAQCGTFVEMQQCKKHEKRTCRTPDFPRLYGLFHEALFRVTPCRDNVADLEVTPISNITIN